MEPSSQSPPKSGVMLTASCPAIHSELSKALYEIGEVGVASQLARVLVVLQDLNGAPDQFSFMAYPIPRLSREERQALELQHRRSIHLKVQSGKVQIDLDDFSQINWFYIDDLPAAYFALRDALSAQRGGAS